MKEYLNGIVPISALKGRNVKELMKVIGNYLEEGPKYFPDYMITDQPERVLVSELIRENGYVDTFLNLAKKYKERSI